MSSLAGHRSGGPRPDITAPPLDLSGLGLDAARRVPGSFLYCAPVSNSRPDPIPPWTKCFGRVHDRKSNGGRLRHEQNQKR